VAKKATVKRAGQKAAPKAARTTRADKTASTPRPGKNAESRSHAATKKTPPRSAAKVTKVTAKPATAKKADPVKDAPAVKKPALAKGTGSDPKPAPAAAKAESSTKAHSGNNRPVSSNPGLDGVAKPRPSQGGTTAPRTPRPSRIDLRREADDLPPEIPPTYLNAAELEEFREMLLEKRRELIGDVANLEDGAIRSGGAHNTSGLSSMPIHMADLGSDTWEQELTLGLIENERGLLREIDEALERIKDRTYGMCLATGKPITKARLRAKPWAKYCIEYARKRELGLV